MNGAEFRDNNNPNEQQQQQQQKQEASRKQTRQTTGLWNDRQPDGDSLSGNGSSICAAEAEEGLPSDNQDNINNNNMITSLQINSKRNSAKDIISSEKSPSIRRANVSSTRQANDETTTTTNQNQTNEQVDQCAINLHEGEGEEAEVEVEQQQQQQLQQQKTLAITTATKIGTNKKKKKSRVLDPSGSLCYHWSMVVSFAFLYNFWSLSYRFAFREIDFDTVAFWFALDYSADLIYLLDVVINFHTGYLEDGVLQRNIDKIGQHYRECTLFYLDCFCLLPLDILYLSIGFNSILRCTRLVKIYKFWSYADRTERHTNYPNVFRTFTLVHYILVIFHWNACLFHMISKNKILDIENLYRINDNRCDDILCQYLHAFYWSTLTLTTIGDLPKPRTKGEYFYVTIELFFGLFLFASVLGHVANIVTNVSAARKEFQAKLDAVKTFMRMRRVSDELQNKVIRWFDYLWVSQKSSDEERSVACLPDRLKAEIAIHVHLDTLKRVDIFQNTEAGFLCELVLRLKPVLFSPGDYVCRKNEVGHEMYIVSKGILEVVTDNGKTVVAILKAGSYFGEISVLNVGLAGNKRTASVRSVGYSDLFCLNKQDLWDVLKNYPNAEARIRARAEERLSKLDINHQKNSQQQQQQHPSAGSHKRSSSGRWPQCYVGNAMSQNDADFIRSFPSRGSQHRKRVYSTGSRYSKSLGMSRRQHLDHLNQVVPEEENHHFHHNHHHPLAEVPFSLISAPSEPACCVSRRNRWPLQTANVLASRAIDFNDEDENDDYEEEDIMVDCSKQVGGDFSHSNGNAAKLSSGHRCQVKGGYCKSREQQQQQEQTAFQGAQRELSAAAEDRNANQAPSSNNNNNNNGPPITGAEVEPTLRQPKADLAHRPQADSSIKTERDHTKRPASLNSMDCSASMSNVGQLPVEATGIAATTKPPKNSDSGRFVPGTLGQRSNSLECLDATTPGAAVSIDTADRRRLGNFANHKHHQSKVAKSDDPLPPLPPGQMVQNSSSSISGSGGPTYPAPQSSRRGFGGWQRQREAHRHRRHGCKPLDHSYCSPLMCQHSHTANPMDILDVGNIVHLGSNAAAAADYCNSCQVYSLAHSMRQSAAPDRPVARRVSRRHRRPSHEFVDDLHQHRNEYHQHRESACHCEPNSSDFSRSPDVTATTGQQQQQLSTGTATLYQATGPTFWVQPADIQHHHHHQLQQQQQQQSAPIPYIQVPLANLATLTLPAGTSNNLGPSLAACQTYQMLQPIQVTSNQAGQQQSVSMSRLDIQATARTDNQPGCLKEASSLNLGLGAKSSDDQTKQQPASSNESEIVGTTELGGKNLEERIENLPEAPKQQTPEQVARHDDQFRSGSQ